MHGSNVRITKARTSPSVPVIFTGALSDLAKFSEQRLEETLSNVKSPESRPPFYIYLWRLM